RGVRTGRPAADPRRPGRRPAARGARRRTPLWHASALWHGLLTVPRLLTEGLPSAVEEEETFGRGGWHGQETVPQQDQGVNDSFGTHLPRGRLEQVLQL